MSKVKRKPVFEGNKSGISSTVGRPSVFERLGPNSSSSVSSGKTQIRKGEDNKHKGHEKSNSNHSRESGVSAAEPLANHGTPKKVRKRRSRSRDKKEQTSDARSKISFRSSESGDHKSKELTSHSPSPKRASAGDNRRKEPETKIKSQVAVVTNRQTNSKVSEKGVNQPNEADWRTDRSHLDFQEEFILEKKRQQLQRELELEMQKERLEEKRASSSSSRSSSSAASSSSSSSDTSSSSTSSSSSEGEDNSSSSFSSVNVNRGKNKAISKRATKMISSQSGSNSETDIIRARKGKIEEKLELKKKVSRTNEGDARKDQQLKINPDKKKKLSATDVTSKTKLTGGSTGSRTNPGGSSSSKPSGSQTKSNEKSKKGSSNTSHKDNFYPETLKIRERSLSPNLGIPSQSRSNKSTTPKKTIFPKKKHNSDSSSVEVPNKVKELKQSSRSKNSSESHKIKPRAPSVDNVHGKCKVNSPNVTGRHTPPHLTKNSESSHPSTRVSKDKRLGRRPASPPPPPPPPQISRLSDIERSKTNRERRHSNSEIATKSYDSVKKAPKEMKERKREGNLVNKSDRCRDDQKSNRSSHVSDMHNPHPKHESDRGRDVKRQRDLDSHNHSHSTERTRLTESRGLHSPLRRERSVGKKSERLSSGNQHPGREGIIDRLRDLSRTSIDVGLTGDYHGRRDSSGRNIPENPPEARSLIDDRLGRGNLERDRRGRLLPEEVNSRYEPPEISDHRRRPLTPPPPPGKYHSRNLTPPRSTTPPPLPPRQWPRDHPDSRESVIPYSSDRRKSPPLPHHYDARSYNDVDVYDYENRTDHRGRDHPSQRGQRKDSYHPFLPSDPMEIYDRDARPRSRQGLDYGHNDQRREDYIQNRWENSRDDRLKGVPEPDRQREGDRWHDDEIKRKRTRDDLQEQLSLPKRRRLTPPPPPPPIDNPRSSRGGTSIESGRNTESSKRKQLSDSDRGNSSRSTTSDGIKTSKQESSSQPSNSKNIDRNKRRSEPGKELNSENKNSKNEETKRKRPRTPEKSDRPSKCRKTSPVISTLEKQTEKIASNESKIVVDKEKILVAADKEEIKPKLGIDKPVSPSGENVESFSDWTDDSMDLLNQEEKVETSDKAAKQVETSETIPIQAIETNLVKDTVAENLPINKDEKIIVVQSSEVRSTENSSLLQKDDKRLRKPKSEGGEDSRGSFEDSLKEKRSRDRNRSSSSKTKSTSSRHPSLERSTRRRYHELNKDKSRSKAGSPASRPRTPVSRPRTPASPSRNAAESAPERDKKPPVKVIDNIIPSVTESTDTSPPPIFDEKITAALDDCEYDPISDDELEAMMEEPDLKDIESEKNVKQNSSDTLDVDWASLVRDKSQSFSEVNKESVLKKFTPASIFYRIGVSAQFAGAELMERIEKVMTDDYAPREIDADNNPEKTQIKTEGKRPKFVFEEKMASMHAMAVAQKKDRQSILDDIGPYRQALCARRDLKIRKQLCRLKLKEILPLSLHSVDVETFKLSLQLFSQRSNSAAGLG